MSQKYCACHTKRLSTRYKTRLKMSRSATPATRNEATRRLKPPKMTTCAELTIGTAIRSSRERLRTVALANATSSEHTLNPQTPRVKREPLLRIREKWYKSFGVLNWERFLCQKRGTLSANGSYLKIIIVHDIFRLEYGLVWKHGN